MSNNTAVVISPEGFEIANAFLRYGDIKNTAEQLDLPQHEIVKTLQQAEVKRYLDGVYLDQGYRNRDKIGQLMDEIIESKLEEARESDHFSSKDLIEILQIQHKMRIDEIKLMQQTGSNMPGVAVQVNNTYGDSNYGRLMEQLTGGS